MTRVLLLISIFISVTIYGQNRRKFLPLLDKTKGKEFEERLAKDVEMEIINFNEELYEEVLLGELNRERGRRHLNDWKQDSMFNKLCNAALKHIERRKLSHSGVRKGFFQHQMDQSMRHLSGENRLFTTYTFYTNLTKLNKFSTYYYDRKEGESTLNLYHGDRRVRYKNGLPEPIEKKPVIPITEKEWVGGIFKYLKQSKRQLGIKSKSYSHIGIAVKVNPYTIRRKSIPHAFVMIIVGGKQTQEVEPARERKYGPIGDTALYELLR